MSESVKERSEDVVGAGGDHDGSGRRDDHWQKQRGHGCGGNLRNAKRVALIRFRKVEKQLHKRNNRAANGGVVVGGGGGCYGCFKQTPTLDSPVESQTSDPNSPEFTYGLLRALIDKNDFYSKECNPHLDTDNPDVN